MNKHGKGINAAGWFARQSFNAREAERQAEFNEAHCARCGHRESEHDEFVGACTRDDCPCGTYLEITI